MTPAYPFRLDPAELRDLETIPAEILDERYNEEYEPGILEIDRARDKRNPKYFAGIFRTILRLVPISRALGEVDLARQRLALAPDALREAFDFDWSPDGTEAQYACSVAVTLGERSLAAAAAKADGGFSVFLPDGTHIETADVPQCGPTRCLAALAVGDETSARRELDAMTADLDDVVAASDQRLLTGHIRLLGAVLDVDEAKLDDAARTLTSRLLDHIALQRRREESGDLIDWLTTASLAVALRRGMRIPTDLPTCAVDLIAPKWVD